MTTKEYVQAKVIDVVTKYAGRETDVQPTSTLAELNMDSLDAIEVAMAVEMEFEGVELPDDVWDDDTTVQAIVDNACQQLGIAP